MIRWRGPWLPAPDVRANFEFPSYLHESRVGPHLRLQEKPIRKRNQSRESKRAFNREDPARPPTRRYGPLEPRPFLPIPRKRRSSNTQPRTLRNRKFQPRRRQSAAGPKSKRMKSKKSKTSMKKMRMMKMK